MNGFRLRALLVAVLALGSAACGDDLPTSSTPPATAITEPLFTGTLTVNGAVTLPFSVTRFGEVSATLKALDPDPDASTRVGVALGTWNGTSCALVITREQTGVGTTILGQASAAGALCVRVFDAGTLTQPTAFTVEITHF